MGTRGRVVSQYRNKICSVYNHMDSYPTVLGNAIIRDILYLLYTLGIDKIREMLSSQRIVNDGDSITQADCSQFDIEYYEGIKWDDIFDGGDASLASMVQSDVAYDEDPLDYKYSYVVDWDDQTLTEEWTGMSLKFNELSEDFFTEEHDELDRAPTKEERKMEENLNKYVKHLLSLVENAPDLHHEFVNKMYEVHLLYLERNKQLEVIPAGTYARMYKPDGTFFAYRQTKVDHTIISMPYLNMDHINIEDIFERIDYSIRVKTNRNDIKLYLSYSALEQEESDEIATYTIYLSPAREGRWRVYREKAEGCTKYLTYKGTSLYPHKYYNGYYGISESFKILSKDPKSYVKEFISFEKL